jgi:hypothetical protein
MIGSGLCGCFLPAAQHVGAVSLNPSEQRVFDYLQGHTEEKKYWMGKVQGVSAAEPDPHTAANRLEQELWRYYKERSEIVPSFREAARHEGTHRISMKSLAEFLLRLWIAPRPKKPSSANTSS